jgi:hypothetical protein
MIKLDDDLLQELGLAALPAEEKKKLLAHIYETLEMRVGMKLAEQMSDAQLTEFEQFIDRNDEAGALKWLESNFPNYKDVVASEFERLKSEIGQVAPQIMAAGSAGQSAGRPPQQQPTGQPSAQPPQPYPQQQNPWQGGSGYAAPGNPAAPPPNSWQNQATPPPYNPPGNPNPGGNDDYSNLAG